MAYFNKAGLLILNEDRTKFLACEKNNFTTDLIIPGGQFEEGEDDETCLAREILEELSAEVDKESLKYINEYIDIAAGDPTKDVLIRLYEGKIIGSPKPSSEIIGFHWIGNNDPLIDRLSPIIKNKIIPDLVAKRILI